MSAAARTDKPRLLPSERLGEAAERREAACGGGNMSGLSVLHVATGPMIFSEVRALRKSIGPPGRETLHEQREFLFRMQATAEAQLSRRDSCCLELLPK